MDLINKQVVHKSFGKGGVVEYDDSYIEINFPLGIKKFVFPDAFAKYLTLTDQRAAALVRKMIEKKDRERKEKNLELKRLRARQHEEKQRLLKREKLAKNPKNHPSSQAVFWCKTQGLEEILTQWRIFTGVIKSGQKKGRPRRLVRMNQNCGCLLTVREPSMPEKDRYIAGAYMVNEFFNGKLCEDGYIPAHSKYRLRLSEQESEKMLFWNYYINKRYPHKITWNTGRHRYFDNIWMAQILRDIVSLKTKTPEQEFVQSFFEYFCKMNRIKEEELPEPNGALKRM